MIAEHINKGTGNTIQNQITIAQSYEIAFKFVQRKYGFEIEEDEEESFFDFVDIYTIIIYNRLIQLKKLSSNTDNL